MNVIRASLLRGVYFSQVSPCLQKVVFPDRFSIVMYHAILDQALDVPDWCFLDVTDFLKQITYLKKYFNLLSLQDAINLSRNGKVNRPIAVVTFDDGFQNNFDVAFPILQQLQIPATIFLTTALVDSDDTLWFCRLNKALTETSKNELHWRGCVYALKDTKARAESSARLQAQLKELNQSVLYEELKQICSSLAVAFDTPIDRNSPYRMLDRPSIACMTSSGLVDFGAHTVNHTILTKVPTAIAANEIAQSIHAVAELSGKPCTFFSYPNGRYQDFDERCISNLQDLGVTASVTTASGSNNARTPLLKLKRYGVGHDMTIEAFSFAVHGFLEWFRRLKTIFSRIDGMKG